MRTYLLKMVRPRNDKILELVDHFLLLEDEELEMKKSLVDLLAYGKEARRGRARCKRGEVVVS